ncbi:oxygen-independent coproporphyrinogen III oxidase [Commensalibacter papalotli (ex Botero et al. 2024)]|uniref:oxygen-independent coproporphyrinogen III oxidase n=1 Tax=Commensalibacter papalotli (ex Botero et al. 2024) TaxID=2972766 RepID=UPI0022FF8F83|nr:oxygen-independent coproporphyrinogen III oxidase [Commensalibacter papalotli (ex Botero et al. 2024)]CAI3941042.1 Coproporphyrinogen-III oxidase HemN (oxygen-independent) or related Fe-S oxidoreductase (HemN) (PDB:1OLT) [Commensalibacter papalotli (ex Botero et al. 2024)]
MTKGVSFDRLARYEGNLPRYTSYPTAVQFTEAVGFNQYKEWLQALPEGEPVSLYLHVPFCDELCKFCACNTQVVHQELVRSAYGDLLCEELKRLAGLLQARRSVSFIHFGGGTPTTLPMNAMKKVMQTIYSLFDIQKNADISIELDPRHVSVEYFSMLHPLGFTRVSFGVQDLDPKVQKACGRIQSKELTAHCIKVVRQNNIQSVNVDLIYGLPNQTVESLRATIRSVVELKPDRLAVFGYAHVPWKFKRQTLLEGDVLPDSVERFQQRQVIDEILQGAGYQVIGLDHYALPHDSMSIAADKGTLHRNFQGYTVDDAPALLGVGASSVSIVPQGIVQNHSAVAMYQKAMTQEGLPVARGLKRDEEDLLRWHVIERLMCDLHIDLELVTRQYNKPEHFFDEAIAKLKPFEEDALVKISGYKIIVTEEGRCFLRNIAVVFDTYYRVAPQRHAQAI